jgi:hypothetical protein|tara:strand:+ start:110 stop:409 length:300 start_codon:yes stop_codon:yes gene_type:complete
MSMTKEEILKKAKDLISGDRNDTHGDAFQNHAEIAEFWNIFLDKKLQPMASITAEDVALMMVLMKISRNNQGKKNNLDNFIDMCGYAAIAGEINDAGSF